jgi:PadR family transcriptional regulator, regulatory protein PadR
VECGVWVPRPESRLQGDAPERTLDTLVLGILTMGPAHGHTIAHAIERGSGDVLQIDHGSLYPALHRLETRGWITSCWGTAGDNHRARYYRLTSASIAQITGREDVPLVQVFLGVSIALVLSARPSAQMADGRPAFEVITEDRSSAGVELGIARARVNHIFITAGIRVVWRAHRAVTGATGTHRIRLVVLSGPAADEMFRGHGDLLGLALPSLSRVYVHYGRVLALARHDKTPPGWFLGMVIAHEVAHVLRPDAGHAESGLMGATLSPEATPAFTAQQAQSLRARLYDEMTLAGLDVR